MQLNTSVLSRPAPIYESSSALGNRVDDVETEVFCNACKRILNFINQYVISIEDLKELQHKHVNSVIKGYDNAKLQQDIEDMEDVLRHQQIQIKDAIDDLKLYCNTSDRDQVHQVNNMNRNFRMAISKLMKHTSNYENQLLQQAVSLYQEVNKKASKKDARDYVENLGTKRVLQMRDQNTTYDDVKKTYEMMDDRYLSVKRIEDTTRELSKLTTNLQDITVSQNAQIDAIADHIQDSQVDLEGGNVQILEASSTARNRNRWKRSILLVSIALSIFLGLFITGFALRYSSII